MSGTGAAMLMSRPTLGPEAIFVVSKRCPKKHCGEKLHIIRRGKEHPTERPFAE